MIFGVEEEAALCRFHEAHRANFLPQPSSELSFAPVPSWYATKTPLILNLMTSKTITLGEDGKLEMGGPETPATGNDTDDNLRAKLPEEKAEKARYNEVSAASKAMV